MTLGPLLGEALGEAGSPGSPQTLRREDPCRAAAQASAEPQEGPGRRIRQGPPWHSSGLPARPQAPGRPPGLDADVFLEAPAPSFLWRRPGRRPPPPAARFPASRPAPGPAPRRRPARRRAASAAPLGGPASRRPALACRRSFLARPRRRPGPAPRLTVRPPPCRGRGAAAARRGWRAPSPTARCTAPPPGPATSRRRAHPADAGRAEAPP